MSLAHQSASAEPRHGFDRISLRRLVLIRWVAIAGQALTLLVVHYGFGFALPLLRGVRGRRLLGAAQSGRSRCTGGRRRGSASARPLCSSATTCCSSALLLYLTGGLRKPVLDPDPGAGHRRGDDRCRGVR